MVQRKIVRVTKSSWHQGFLGIGHMASNIFGTASFEETDPFIIFMDDKLNLPGGKPVGGPHPHAGFETLTLVLQGNEKEWKTGSFELMTAGKGIIHTEEISTKQDIHILQVWLALPREKRWVQPFWQRILLEDVPTLKHENYEIRVYSGSSNGLTSPIRNYTPLTLIDYKMNNRGVVSQLLPQNQNGIIYVLNGVVRIDDKIVKAGEVGWLDKSIENNDSQIQFYSVADNTRFVLYAATPHHVPIVAHGPFIGDTRDDIVRLYKEYHNGEMIHVKDISEDQKLEHALQYH